MKSKIELGEDKFIKDIPERLIMLFLRETNPEVYVKYSIDDLNTFEDKIKSTADRIRRNEFEGSKGKHCDWCDYRDLICPLLG